MQKITPHLWFDKEAKAAAEFYVSIFPNSKITHLTTLHDTPSGDCDMLSFELNGYELMAISAGPYFKINPAVSFMLNFDPSSDPQAKEHLDALWEKLMDGGKALMPLQEYPFSKHYGWVEDKFGVSWQLILTNPTGEPRPFLVPSVMFTQEHAGQANPAIEFYTSVFKNSKRGTTAAYPEGMEPDKAGTLMFADFQLEGQWFAAMDSAHKHEFKFNEAISFLVHCDTQAEIDELWGKLSAVPEAEQCGWLKDKFGFSWQIAPTVMSEMLSCGDPAKIARVTSAFMPMKKFDLQKLKEAFEG